MTLPIPQSPIPIVRPPSSGQPWFALSKRETPITRVMMAGGHLLPHEVLDIEDGFTEYLSQSDERCPTLIWDKVTGELRLINRSDYTIHVAPETAGAPNSHRWWSVAREATHTLLPGDTDGCELKAGEVFRIAIGPSPQVSLPTTPTAERARIARQPNHVLSVQTGARSGPLPEHLVKPTKRLGVDAQDASTTFLIQAVRRLRQFYQERPEHRRKLVYAHWQFIEDVPEPHTEQISKIQRALGSNPTVDSVQKEMVKIMKTVLALDIQPSRDQSLRWLVSQGIFSHDDVVELDSHLRRLGKPSLDLQ